MVKKKKRKKNRGKSTFSNRGPQILSPSHEHHATGVLGEIQRKLDVLFFFPLLKADEERIESFRQVSKQPTSLSAYLSCRKRRFHFEKTDADKFLLVLDEMMKNSVHPLVQFCRKVFEELSAKEIFCYISSKEYLIVFTLHHHFKSLSLQHKEVVFYPLRLYREGDIDQRVIEFVHSSLEKKALFEEKCFQTLQKLEAITSDSGVIRANYRLDLDDWVLRVQQLIEKAQKELKNSSVKMQIKEISYFDLFPLARGMNRKIVFYVGPTNSGKTYHGFSRLMESSQGIYLAPLRLMALEGKEEIEKRGASCSLVTGEEKIIVEGARFQSSTVEMIDFEKEVDTALIDEIQMINDEDRGSAFTAALVGVPAKTVVLTGSASAARIVQDLAERMGEELEIVELTRLTDLIVQKTPVNFNTQFDNGTAIVAFSRSDIIAVREGLLSKGYTVSVIYGGLGPEVRKEEARRFREGETQILVASDAIGMGLNLPIHKIIFFSLEKFNGYSMEPLSRTSIKQIAGRAGRYGQFPVGKVAAFKKDWAKRIETALSEKESQIYRARTAPRLFQIEQFMVDTGATFSKAFQYLSDVNTGDCFVSGVTETSLYIAQMLEKMNLSIKDRFCLIHAPVDMKNEVSIGVFHSWASDLVKKTTPTLPKFLLTRSSEIPSAKQLGELEQRAKLLMVYRWLHQRFSDVFVQIHEVNEQLEWIDSKIMKTLKARIWKRCTRCHAKMDHFSRHAICDNCYDHHSYED